MHFGWILVDEVLWVIFQDLGFCFGFKTMQQGFEELALLLQLYNVLTVEYVR